MLPKLAIISTHPIQYNAPWYKMLTERGKIYPKVFYTWEQAKDKVYDPDFKREIKWDIPLLDGYEYTFVKNVARDPGSHHFFGIDNPSILKEIKDFNPDAILLIGWSYKSHVKVLRYFKTRIPIIFRGDSTLMNDVPGVKSLIRKIFLRWIYKHVDKAVYVGKQNKAYYLHAGMHEDQLIFAPHAIDNIRFNNILNSNADIKWREKLNIPASDLVFLFAGKFEPRKDPHILVDAFLELNASNAHLVLVGNGIYEEDLKTKCAKAGNIHFIDFQNQQVMPSVYSFSDVYVLPSVSETWGLAVNEAMACSKAVLVSDKCGCAVDLVKENVNGYIFKSSVQEDLLNKLALFINKPINEIHKMGINSHSIIQEWSFENICKSVEQAVIEYT